MSSNQDAIISIIQSSTRSIIDSFNDKTKSLSASCEDINQLIRVGFDSKVACDTARNLFGDDIVEFLAIDGTKSEDQKLDILVFYTAAFGYVGKLKFSDEGCVSSDPVAIDNKGKDVSAAIPIHEADAGDIMGIRKEGDLEIDIERLPSALMQLAEYYIAVKTLLQNPNVKVVIFDRQLAIDVPHLISNVTEIVESDTNTLILNGLETEFGQVLSLDIELARMLHPNEGLQIPFSRSQFLKYAAINSMISKSDDTILGYENLLNRIGASKERLKKLKKDLEKFDSKFHLFKSNGNLPQVTGDNVEFHLDSRAKDYWKRVFSASIKLADHIFDTPLGEHPLLFKKDGVKKWITTYDVEYLTLMMIYGLVRLAWEKNILIIGMIKDMAAAELIKTVIPILEANGDINFTHSLPKFSNDRMLLQCNSIINAKLVKTPWKTFEFDACFRTMAPIREEVSKDSNKVDNQSIRVKGAFKNLISIERMFVKSYIQLWSSIEDPAVRSYVFSYDRPCYPKYDIAGELLLHHHDNNVDEEIRPMIHFIKDSDISHLVMAILSSMSSEAIPECLGHNYALFIADKKAKAILREARKAYIAAVSFEMAQSKLDQQVLFGPSFREFRSSMERARRNA
jgi:hypothetical protein